MISFNDIPHVVTDRAIHERSRKPAIVGFEPPDDLIVLLIFRAGIKKPLVLFMLVDHIEHALVGTVGAVKDLSFTVKNKFLQVKCNGFGDTEILGVLRNGNLHLFAHPEEMIYSIAAGKYDGSVKIYFDLLLAKILGRDPFYPYKRVKIKFYTVFPGKLEIGRLLGIGLGLGN